MKSKVTVHQIHLTRDEVDTLNRIGREEAHKLDRKFLAYDEIKFDGFEPDFWQYYSEQGSIEVEFDPREVHKTLDLIFAAGNDDGYGLLAPDYTRYPTAFSISVGDIIKFGECAYLVAPCGFDRVELAS